MLHCGSGMEEVLCSKLDSLATAQAESLEKISDELGRVLDGQAVAAAKANSIHEEVLEGIALVRALVDQIDELSLNSEDHAAQIMKLTGSQKNFLDDTTSVPPSRRNSRASPCTYGGFLANRNAREQSLAISFVGTDHTEEDGTRKQGQRKRSYWQVNGPEPWPSGIEIRPNLKLAFSQTRRLSHVSRVEIEMAEGLTRMESEEQTRRRIRFSISPTSLKRLALDCVLVLVLVFELTLTPLVLAWQFNVGGNLFLVWLCCAAFWSFDILCNFTTGFFFSHGELCLENTKIAMRYLRTWFAADASMALCDWIAVLLLLDGRMQRSIYYLKAVGFGRLLRVPAIFARISSAADFLGISTLFQVIKILLCLVYTNHLMACGWYGIRWLPDSTVTWLDAPYIMGEDGMQTYSDASPMFQYTTALHWSLSQMTPGSMEVHPFNTTERWFNLLCLVLSVVFFGTLVSMLSSKILHFKMTMEKQQMEESTLRTFLLQKGISTNLAGMVHKQVQERARVQRPLLAENVRSLELISQKLRSVLQYEMCISSISVHPFLRMLNLLHSGFMISAVNEAMSFRVLAPGDVLFLAGAEAHGMFLLTSGTMKYSFTLPSTAAAFDQEAQVEAGSWISEAAMWCEWHHIGNAEAMSVGEIMVVNALGFLTAARSSKRVWKLVQDYGNQFVARLTSSRPPYSEYPTDIQVPTTSFTEVVPSMSLNSRVAIGEVFLGELKKETSSLTSRFLRLGSDQHWITDLEKEVRRGSSTIVQTREGELERVVTLAAVKPTRQNGRLSFVQLGSYSNAKGLEAECKLFGSKQVDTESPFAAASRILREALAPFERQLSLNRSETEVVSSMSKKFNVETTYMRTIFLAPMEESFLTIGSGATLMKAPLNLPGFNLEVPEVFFLKDSDKVRFGGWVKPNEFEHLCSPAGRSGLFESLSAEAVSEQIRRMLAAGDDSEGGMSSSVDNDVAAVEEAGVGDDDLGEASFELQVDNDVAAMEEAGVGDDDLGEASLELQDVSRQSYTI